MFALEQEKILLHSFGCRSNVGIGLGFAGKMESDDSQNSQYVIFHPYVFILKFCRMKPCFCAVHPGELIIKIGLKYSKINTRTDLNISAVALAEIG